MNSEKLLRAVRRGKQIELGGLGDLMQGDTFFIDGSQATHSGTSGSCHEFVIVSRVAAHMYRVLDGEVTFSDGDAHTIPGNYLSGIIPSSSEELYGQYASGRGEV